MKRAVVIAQVIVARHRQLVAKEIKRAIMVVKSAVQVVMPIVHRSKGQTTRRTLNRLQKSSHKSSPPKDRSLQSKSYQLSSGQSSEIKSVVA